MRIVSFDFESKDPYLKRKFGPGWVYKYHNYQACDFEVLGMAWYDGTDSGYITDFSTIPEILDNCDVIIAHNAQYDMGCLEALGFGDLVKKYYGKTICTVMSSKLVDSSQMSYGLDWLSKKWLNIQKQGQELFQDVWNKCIFPLTQKELKEGRSKEIPQNKKSRVKNWTMENLDIIQEASIEVVAKYAIADAKVCYELLQECVKRGKSYYKDPLEVFCKWGKLLHICQDYTKRGIRVDMERIDMARQWLKPRIAELRKKIFDMVGFEFNIMSSHQLPKVFETLGLSVGQTAKGAPSVTKERLESETHPIAQLIRDCKQYSNILNNFINKMDDLQYFTMKPGEREDRQYGRVHPTYTPMGAKTGRFSCVPMQVKALTRSGWKTYEELVIGEDILAYDMGKRKQVWTPLRAKTKLKNQVVGSVGLKTRKFRCTEDHKWVVLKGHTTTHYGKTYHAKEQLVQAGDIKKGHRILMNAPYESGTETEVNIFIFETNKYGTNYEELITRMSNPQLDSFVLGFLLADGHNNSAGTAGSRMGWQWTQAKTVTREQLLTATYMQHWGRIGCGKHTIRQSVNHTESCRITMCYSPFTAVNHTWEPESIEDVWCPTTDLGTWVMRDGDLITITGNCNGPNLQQIPKRNKDLGVWCRGIFVPEDGDSWYSLDFSNQEGRIQAHYAYLTKCDGASNLVEQFKVDPKYDLHQEVADICNISRTNAKTINLGLSYGMGEGKLCHSLGLPTRKIDKYGRIIEVAGPEGKEILDKYNDLFPFLKQLIEKATSSAKQHGYIRTIGGRAVSNDRAIIDGKLVLFEHKAFNQLTQGSAFDQTALCMIKAYEQGLPVMLTIHDELNLSGNEEQAQQLKDIMENTVKLSIPSVTDIGSGVTWWEAC